MKSWKSTPPHSKSQLELEHHSRKQRKIGSGNEPTHSSRTQVIYTPMNFTHTWYGSDEQATKQHMAAVPVDTNLNQGKGNL